MSVTRFLGFLDISPHLFNPPAAEGMQGAGRPGGPDSALISLLPPPAKGRQATVHQVSDLHFLFFSITPTVWVHAKSLQSCPTLCNPMDYIVRQAPLSMGFSRQESWSVLPFPSPRDLPNPGIELKSPTLQADSLPFEPPGKPKNTGVDSLPAELPGKPIIDLDVFK